MHESGAYEQYPAHIVLIANLLSMGIYLIGLFLLWQYGPVWAALYLVYIIILEFRLMGSHCIDCYYYGKTCAFGKGRLSCLIFRKGEPERFIRMAVSWKTILPDFLSFIIPVLAGILLLIGEFRIIILALVIALVLLGFFGNAFVRGHLACKFCRQRELGCPAAQFFDKK